MNYGNKLRPVLAEDDNCKDNDKVIIVIFIVVVLGMDRP